jgi:hypothetical protein
LKFILSIIITNFDAKSTAPKSFEPIFLVQIPLYLPTSITITKRYLAAKSALLIGKIRILMQMFLQRGEKSSVDFEADPVPLIARAMLRPNPIRN